MQVFPPLQRGGGLGRGQTAIALNFRTPHAES